MAQTTATLTDIVDAVADIADGLSGIRKAPHEPPEKLGAVYPYAVTYAGEGAWELAAIGHRLGWHVIVCEIHVGRKNLPYDVKKAMPYSDSFPDAVFNDMDLNSTLINIRRMTYEFGPMAWGGVDTIGFRFRIEGEQVQPKTT